MPGRVTASMRFGVFGTIPAGALLAGALLAGALLAGGLGTALPVRTALWIILTLYAVSGLLLLTPASRADKNLPSQPLIHGRRSRPAGYIRDVNTAAGGWETWSWDESLFAGAAGYYEQGRLPYAPGLADAFDRSLGLDGQGRLLDVGCGPGTVTLRLASLFEAVVGLDPDPEMLACASRAAAGLGAGNATWVRQRAEALPAGLGGFRVVTFAASFHWMDRPRVASAVASMLDPGGAVVQVDAPGYRAGEPAGETGRGTLAFPPPPDDALDQLRRQYLGSDRRAGRGIRNTSPDGEDGVFRQAGFLPAQTVTVPDQRIIERTADDVVAGVFSTSSTAPNLFGDRREDYEADMREILARASPSGRFCVRLPDNILRIWRRPA